MKKRLIVILATLMCISLCACGGSNDNYWKPLPTDASRNQLAQAVSPKSEDEIICVISYTAKNVSKSDKTIKDRGTLKFDDGYTYDEGGLSYRVSEEGVWSNIEGVFIVK